MWVADIVAIGRLMPLSSRSQIEETSDMFRASIKDKKPFGNLGVTVMKLRTSKACSHVFPVLMEWSVLNPAYAH